MEEAVFNMSLNRICYEFSLVAEDAKKELFAKTKSGYYEINQYSIHTDVCANFFFNDPKNFLRNNSWDRMRDDRHLSISQSSGINIEELFNNNPYCKKVIEKAEDMGISACFETNVESTARTELFDPPKTISLSLSRQ